MEMEGHSAENNISMRNISKQVLANIFEVLLPPKLMEVRLICKQWNAVASGVCRRRGLGVADTFCCIFDLFSKPDAENFPFSKLSMQLCLNANEEFVELLHTFSKHYATHITNLTLNNACMLPIVLGSCHNLKELSIEWFARDLEPQEYKSDLRLECLRNLKFTELRNETQLNILEILLNAVNFDVLHDIEIKSDLTSRDLATRLNSLLAKVHNVSMKLVYCKENLETFSAFSKLLPLKKLQLKFEKGFIPMDYHLASRFLQNSPRLEELELEIHGKIERFELPTLAKLKMLKLTFTGSDLQSNRNTNSQHTFLLPLKPNQFPTLEKVRLTGCDLGHYTHGILKDCSFKFVNELELDKFSSDENWRQVFPNLKKLKTEACTSIIGERQIENLEHLELLDIYISSATFPFGKEVLNMKNLKTLVIAFQHRRCISNLFIGPLLQIQPLELLVLANFHISAHAQQELLHRHRRVLLNLEAITHVSTIGWTLDIEPRFPRSFRMH